MDFVPPSNMLVIHHEARMNFRGVGTTFKEQINDPLDDLYCALGAFSIYVMASGKVKPVFNRKTSHEVIIERFGFYIRDTYDFIGFQSLGFWSSEGPSKIPSEGYSYVDNSSFRDWRLKHNKGGDYVHSMGASLCTLLVWNYPY